MSLAGIFEWMQMTALATAVRESAVVYPVIVSTHLASIGIFGGMILWTDLRLLGLVMRDRPAGEVISGLRPWKWAGFFVMVTCGVLLAISKATEYYVNPYFQLKILILCLIGVHGLAFRRTVYRSVAEPEARHAKAAGALSIVLWIGMVSMGRWIAYYEAPKVAVRAASAATAARTSDAVVMCSAPTMWSTGDLSRFSRRRTRAVAPSRT